MHVIYIYIYICIRHSKSRIISFMRPTLVHSATHNPTISQDLLKHI